jgi:hypothetical protein
VSDTQVTTATLDWAEVQRTVKLFLRDEVLGTGYVDDYYDSFAYTLTQYLKDLAAQSSDATSTVTVAPDELRRLRELRDAIRAATS